MTMRPLPVLAAAFALSACAVMEPHYERPAAPVPGAWPEGPAYSKTLPGQPASLPAWRSFFADAKLSALIETALTQNRDLRVAALNIERARAAFHVQRAQSLPAIDAQAAGAVQRAPVSVGGTGDVTRAYTATIGVTSFEIDLFGRVRGLNRAALQQYLATSEARDSVQISLISQVAIAYLTYAGDLELLQLAQDTLVAQQQSLDLTLRRFEAGASSQLDVDRARTTVETARADAARFTALAAQDENLLALLVGAPIPAQLRPTAIDEVAFGVPELPPGLPSEVLLNRPDIRESEHLLRAANANVGAARAAFFPSVVIAGAAGRADPRFENLFHGAGRTWNFTPHISLPIFDGGARIASLGVANAERRIAVAQYERAIQVAFREVADALAQRGAIEDQVDAQRALAEAAQSTFRISQARYSEGVDNYLSLLDAQRVLYGAQQQFVAARVARAANFVTLYKTLGGGV
ncbi:MAG: efflux transporter outer membrane subunit [Hyphomonadaceae bacterium]